jgi:hypothetical protein
VIFSEEAEKSASCANNVEFNYFSQLCVCGQFAANYLLCSDSNSHRQSAARDRAKNGAFVKARTEQHPRSLIYLPDRIRCLRPNIINPDDPIPCARGQVASSSIAAAARHTCP